MSFYSTFSKLAIAGGAMLAISGCGGREKVAIAAKDAELRQQKELIAQERADKDKLSEMNKQLADQNDEMAKRNAEIAQRNAAQTEALTKQVADLEAIMKQMDKNMTEMKPGQKGLDENQSSMWSKGADGSIRITVASSVLFDSGQADLKSSSHTMLKNVSGTIKQRFPNNYIRVEGHTDSTPVVRNKDKFKDNMDLSISRSRAVYDFMIKSGGIAASKMYTAGYGEHQPVVHPEKTAADRSKNRRVEIVIMPDNVKVQKEYMAASAAPKK